MSCDLMIPNSSFLEDLAIADVSDDSSRSTVDSESPSPSRSPVPMMLGKDCDQDKDSGIEFCGEDSLLPLEGLVLPDKELAKGIVDMVEYYFSDANFLKDTFLLKHVRRNKEGYVSLKLITNFRKVKTFTRDWRVVAHSLKNHSKTMQVNDQCTKVRRIVPLPSHDETQPSRTVLVTGLPSAAGSVDGGALELVSRFGDLVLVRLVKPADCSSEQHKDLKKFFARRPDLANSPCFLAEFSKQESAARALKEINEGSSSYTAYSLGDKTQVKQAKVQPPANKQKQSTVPPTTTTTATTKKTRKPTKKVQSKVALDSSDSEHQYSPEMRRRSSSSVSSGYFSSSPRHTDYFERRANTRTLSASAGSPSPVVRPRTRLDSAPVTTLNAEASPWVQRRIAAAAARTQATSTGVIVIREPRGPDGTNGFLPRRNPLLAVCS